MKYNSFMPMRIIAFFIFLSMLCHGLLVPQTQNSTTQNAEKQKNEKLQAINSEIQEINSKLATLKKEEKSILNDIYKIELENEKAVIENNKLKMQLSETNDAIQQKNGEKKQLETDIRKSKKNLEKILRILYKIGGNYYLKLFIRIDSLEQLFKNYRFFIALISYKSDEIKRIETNIKRLTQVKQELQSSHSSLQKLQREQQQKVNSIRALRQGKLNLIRNINNDRSNYIQLLSELKNEATHLDEIIKGEPAKHPLRTLNLDKIKGKLRWPLRGKVVSSFGKKRSTKFNTYIINNGIKIRPTGSPNVRAIYSGEVVFSNYFKGYGNLIIIQHSNALYSLYGYCEKLFKQKGDMVREGELISVAGDTGSTSGKALYFEIRIHSEAQNPIPWLGNPRRG